MILEILKYPDKRLRTIAKPVQEVNSEIKKQVKDMFETMYDADYNSVLVFNSDRLHSRNNFDNFGEGDDSRLIQVAFLKKRNNEEGRVGVF